MKHFLIFLLAVFFTTLLFAQKTSYDLPAGYDRANYEYSDEDPKPFSDKILPEGTRTMRSDFSEGFDDIDLLPPLGWALINNSDPLGITGWFQGNPGVFGAHSGATDSYIGANFNNTAGVGTISNWLLTPEISMNDGDVITFWTRTAAGSSWADRLQVRLSTSGSSTDVGTSATDVGDFTTLLLDINEDLAGTGYPDSWTQYSVTLSGIGEDVDGRIAFRYFVTNGGPDGANSNYIGIDTFSYESNGEEPPPAYCDAGPSSTFDSNVENVFIEGENETEIDHDGVCPGVTGVEDLTDLSVDLIRGETYTLEVTFGTCGATPYNGLGSVWIDWDQDFEFGTGDLIHESIGTPGSGPWDGPVSISFTVPATAELGNTVMRVMQREDWQFQEELPLDPCEDFIWGSVMDFGINILEEAIVLPPGSDCTDPIVVDAFPFEDLGQTTCGMENTYFNTCLGNYDTGEDIHYQFTLTEEQLVTITMDPKGTGWTGMLLTDQCPPPGADCIATSTGSSGIRVIEETLEAGTYFIMISTWPTPACIPDFNLTITTEALPEPPIPPGDLLFSQEFDQGGGYFTSTYDPVNGIDFEIADNFFDLNNTRGGNIDIVEFYGQYLDFAEGAWIPVDPEETEPFWIRFYEYVEDFVPGLEAPETGTYEVELRDSFGDGWAGEWPADEQFHTLTVFVDGVVVLDEITMLDGSGPDIHTFEANAGDEITTIFTIDGVFAAECYYAIYDPSGNLIAEEGGTADNPGQSVPGNIEGGQLMALEPDWDNPVYEGVIDADVEYTGLDDLTFGDPIWKFTVELPESLSMTEGWVSPQLDAENASGDAWFLYNTSLEGDGLSFRRDGEAKNIVIERSQDYHPSGRHEGFERFIGREALDEDFAFSLFTRDDDEEPAPIPLSSWALYLSILLMGVFIFVRFRKMM